MNLECKSCCNTVDCKGKFCTDCKQFWKEWAEKHYKPKHFSGHKTCRGCGNVFGPCSGSYSCPGAY